MMLKLAGQFLGWALSLSLKLRYVLLRVLLRNRNRALSLASESAARRPGLLGLYARQSFYKSTLKQCGNDVHIGYQTLLSKAEAMIGDRVYLGRFCTVGCVTIGADTRIADGVQLLSGRHHHGAGREGVDLDLVQYDSITIGKGVWIGANAVVMADVGDGAIVGAGAVVTRPVAPGTVVAGVPAQPISGPNQPSSRQAA